MQEVVANVTNIKFDIEFALEQQLGAQPLPFPGMDKSGAAICTFYLRSLCSKGGACPFRHVKGDRTIVCKHWLRGLCKKGDDCEFLHEYDMTKMPECYFFSKFGLCSNKECPFLHIDPEKKIRDCPWYDRGFCRHGPNCKNRHVRRVICLCYLNGFCLEGPNCKFMHPKFDLPTSDPVAQAKKASIVCHFCGETGHKAANCPSMGHNAVRPQTVPVVHTQNESAPRPQVHTEPRRPLDQVTCYKCGEKGHYANKCPKGHLAFLSSSLAPQQT
ncbi:cleavage and polyadenylation specificity factor subunit 4-like [Liolophura sinensis]|uniref:cleavage and polyadenylation specificity factor subunit 4-like n=1 Tax=Liolophura sinensis TaxID=3198878 RepID=UPI0031586CFC